MKKIILVLLVLISIFGFRIARADVIINEIMYNPNGSDTGKEWIELFNSSNTESVNIISGKSSSAWRFDDGSTSLHYINEDLTIPPNGYAVLADDKNTFLSEYPNFSGLIADTSMSLDNSGIVKIWNGDDPRLLIASQAYNNSLGADNDGNSLQLVGSSWIAAIPTPGAQNQAIENTSNDTSGNSTNDNNTTSDNINTNSNSISSLSSGGSNSVTTKTKTKSESPTIKVKILANDVAFVGQPTEFDSSVLGYSNEKLVLGKLFWNFGDGSSLEQTNNFQKINHIYLYPGEYATSLEYYSNGFAATPDAINKMKIKVTPMSVSISKIGDAKDFFIELTNNADYDIDISGWTISANNKNFVLPKDSMILSKQPMIVPGKITGFVFGDEKNLKLIMPTGEVVFIYNNSNILGNVSSNKIIPKNIISQTTAISPLAKVQIPNNINLNKKIPGEDLSAASIENKVETNENSNDYLFFVGFAVLLGVAGISVYFIRHKKIVQRSGDDFEILDE